MGGTDNSEYDNKLLAGARMSPRVPLKRHGPAIQRDSFTLHRALHMSQCACHGCHWKKNRLSIRGLVGPFRDVPSSCSRAAAEVCSKTTECTPLQTHLLHSAARQHAEHGVAWALPDALLRLEMMSLTNAGSRICRFRLWNQQFLMGTAHRGLRFAQVTNTNLQAGSCEVRRAVQSATPSRARRCLSSKVHSTGVSQRSFTHRTCVVSSSQPAHGTQ